MSPQIFYYSAPLIIIAAADWLQHDTLPPRINAIIVIVVTFLVAALWALLSGQLVGNLNADIIVVAALSFAIMALPQLDGLHSWLQEILVSPLAPFAPPRIVQTYIPTPTPRASSLGTGQTWTQRVAAIDADLSAQPTRPMPPATPVPTTPDETPAPTLPPDATPGQGS